MNLSFDVKRFLACVGPKGVTVSVEIGVMLCCWTRHLSHLGLSASIYSYGVNRPDPTQGCRERTTQDNVGRWHPKLPSVQVENRFSRSAIFSIGGPTILC